MILAGGLEALADLVEGVKEDGRGIGDLFLIDFFDTVEFGL